MSGSSARRIWGAASGSLVMDVAALCLAGAVAYAVLQQRGERPLKLQVEDWDTVTASELTIGPAGAKVTIVEFVDYQCPMCLVVDGLLSELQSEYPGMLRRVIRHFPLTRTHPRADSAAVLATCASAQGAFEPVHRVLFERRDLVERGAWDSLTTLAPIANVQQLRTCFQAADAFGKVADDVRLGRRFGVSSTPTLVVDREWMSGISPPRLRELLLSRVD